MPLRKNDWILLILREKPLDRIHIMKILFLIWHRAGRSITDYFEFTPYLYGPCSLEVYSVLESLQSEGYILRPPHLRPQWVNYYLSDKGEKTAEEALKRASPDIIGLIKRIVEEVSQLNFYDLLRLVYTEAPDYAINSIFGRILKP